MYNAGCVYVFCISVCLSSLWVIYSTVLVRTALPELGYVTYNGFISCMVFFGHLAKKVFKKMQFFKGENNGYLKVI